ncbi:MAG: zinc ABC transporter substrate-binding protein [Sedimenticolaceae bacterium]
MPARLAALVAAAAIMLGSHVADASAGGTPRVVASIAPLHSLVSAVMLGVESPLLLLHGGQSPHTFSLRPSDARALDGADVLFWIGPALEQPLQRILPNLRVTRSVAMLEAAGVELLPARELGDSDDAHHDHAASDGGETAFVDPHLWLSPGNAIAMSKEIARVLSQVDPANAGRYDVNTAQLVQRLTTLDKDLRVKLSDATAPYAVFHDAYQYLEQRYGLHAAGTVTTHAERSPGAAHLHALRASLVSGRVRCLFSEPQFQPRMVAALSEGLPIRHAILDPLGSDIPPGPDAYFLLMRSIADTLTDCLRGDPQ